MFTRPVSGFLNKVSGDLAFPRASLFEVPWRQYVIRPSQQPCEEAGDLTAACRRGNQTLQKTPARLSRPQTSSPCVCCAFKGDVLIIRAFAARAVKIPQRLFGATYPNLPTVPRGFSTSLLLGGFSPVPLPGAPSPSTCRQEAEEQRRSGRPEDVRLQPRAVSTPLLPSHLSAGTSEARALRGPRPSPGLRKASL